MRYVTVERTIQRRPEVVWEILTDATGLTNWIEGLIDARLRFTDEAVSAGTVIELFWQRGKRPLRGTAEVTGFRPGALLAIETRIGDGLFFDRARLEGDGRATRLEIVSEVMSGFGVADFFARPRGLLGAPNEDDALQKLYERSADALVKRIESKSAIPYR